MRLKGSLQEDIFLIISVSSASSTMLACHGACASWIHVELYQTSSWAIFSSSSVVLRCSQIFPWMHLTFPETLCCGNYVLHNIKVLPALFPEFIFIPMVQKQRWEKLQTPYQELMQWLQTTPVVTVLCATLSFVKIYFYFGVTSVKQYELLIY